MTTETSPEADHDAATPPRRRSSRRQATPQQNLAIAVVTVLAAVAAALSDAAPTGSAVVDLVYRVGFVVGVTLAATRARRWSLVVGAAVCAAGSIGVALLVSAAVLVLSVVLVVRDRRNRVLGAVVGASVASVCLHLSVGGFMGSATLVGAVAALAILRSGYRNSSTRERRIWRRITAAVVVFVLAATVVAGVAALLSANSLRRGVDLTRQGVTAVRDGQTREAGVLFGLGRVQFDDASDSLDAWWTAPARLVPFVGQNLRLVSGVSTSGSSLAEAGKRTAEEVDYDSLRNPDGGIDLTALAKLSAPVVDAAARLDAAARSVQDLESPWIVGPLSDQFDEFRTRVGQLQREAALARLAITDGPGVLGSTGSRRYLVLFGDPAEARDLGGHIGNWAELVVDRGHLQLVHVGQPRELTRRASDQELAFDPRDYDSSLVALQPGRYPQNWGGSPDFPMDARLAADLFQRATGRSIDGVFYADPHTLAAMLDVTGPVEIPGLNRRLRSSEAVEFLTLGQFSAYRTQQVADDSLTELIRRVFDEFTHHQLPGPKKFADLFGDVTRRGRLRFVSMHDEDHRLLARLGLDLGVPFDLDGDVLGVISRNANPNKLDSFLHRSSTYRVQWDPDSGEVDATVAVKLRADLLPPGLPSYVVGNDQGKPVGTNVTDLALISPFELTSVTVDGQPHSVSPVFDGRWWRYTVRTDLGQGQTREVRFHLEGVVDTADHYRLTVLGQPLLNEGSIDLDLTSSRGVIVPGPGITTDGPHVRAEVGDHGVTVLDVSVRGG